jgi:hypothetical protein
MLDRISSNSVRTILLLLLADSNRYVRSAAALFEPNPAATGDIS